MLSSIGTNAYNNPKNLLLSELKTFKDGKSQFAEVCRPNDDISTPTDGYSMLVAETVTQGVQGLNSKGRLNVKCVFDLQSKSFLQGRKYAAVGRHPNEAEAGDLMTWTPTYKEIRLPSKFVDDKDFLSVSDNEIMVVFLMYSEVSVFDQSVWPVSYRSGRNFFLTDNLLQYTIKNSVDAMIISGLGAPPMKKDVADIFKEMFKFETCATPVNPTCRAMEAAPTSSNAQIPLSIGRCGTQSLPYLFYSYKHGKIYDKKVLRIRISLNETKCNF